MDERLLSIGSDKDRNAIVYISDGEGNSRIADAYSEGEC